MTMNPIPRLKIGDQISVKAWDDLCTRVEKAEKFGVGPGLQLIDAPSGKIVSMMEQSLGMKMFFYRGLLPGAHGGSSNRLGNVNFNSLAKTYHTFVDGTNDDGGTRIHTAIRRLYPTMVNERPLLSDISMMTGDDSYYTPEFEVVNPSHWTYGSGDADEHIGWAVYEPVTKMWVVANPFLSHQPTPIFGCRWFPTQNAAGASSMVDDNPSAYPSNRYRFLTTMYTDHDTGGVNNSSYHWGYADSGSDSFIMRWPAMARINYGATIAAGSLSANAYNAIYGGFNMAHAYIRRDGTSASEPAAITGRVGAATSGTAHYHNFDSPGFGPGLAWQKLAYPIEFALHLVGGWEPTASPEDLSYANILDTVYGSFPPYPDYTGTRYQSVNGSFISGHYDFSLDNVHGGPYTRLDLMLQLIGAGPYQSTDGHLCLMPLEGWINMEPCKTGDHRGGIGLNQFLGSGSPPTNIRNTEGSFQWWGGAPARPVYRKGNGTAGYGP